MNFVLTEKEYLALKAAAERPPEAPPFFVMEEPATLEECKDRFILAVFRRMRSKVAAAKVLDIDRSLISKALKRLGQPVPANANPDQVQPRRQGMDHGTAMPGPSGGHPG